MTPYLNLTSGLEAAPRFPGARLVRIQSSQLETFALWKVIAELDYGFLFDAAIGGALLVDCGSRRSAVSRAQWQGVPWVRYAYRRTAGLIFGREPMHNEFAAVYERSHPARDSGRAKLRYVRKMTGADDLRIEFESFVSTMDGNYDGLREILLTHCHAGGAAVTK